MKFFSTIHLVSKKSRNTRVTNSSSTIAIAIIPYPISLSAKLIHPFITKHFISQLFHLAVQCLNSTLHVTTAKVRSIGQVIGDVLRISRQNQVKGVSARPSTIDIPPQFNLSSISASLDWLDVYGVMVAIKLRVSRWA